MLLLGVAVTDLAHSALPRRLRKRLPGVIGAAVTLFVGLAVGLTAARDLVALVLIAAVVVGWEVTVARGFARDRAGVPLALLGTALLVVWVLSPLAGEAGGLLGGWLGRGPVLVGGLEPDAALLLAAAVLLQMSTGNVVVRLVLSATGTLNPADQDTEEGPETRLKGGRLLGPMERLFILGLGLAGQLTAAAIVIAAKGLLRFPELSSKSEQQRIHRLTEYFLVGSFVSWLVALGSLVLLRG